MAEHYTDEDVAAGAKVLSDEGGAVGHSLHSWRCEYDPCFCLPETARAVLDAVAPAIAARALREAASALHDPNCSGCVAGSKCAGMATWLRDRADDVLPTEGEPCCGDHDEHGGRPCTGCPDEIEGR